MQGKSYGAILALQKIAKEMGIINALGNTDNGKMALWQVVGRALFQRKFIDNSELFSSITSYFRGLQKQATQS